MESQREHDASERGSVDAEGDSSINISEDCSPSSEIVADRESLSVGDEEDDLVGTRPEDYQDFA